MKKILFTILMLIISLPCFAGQNIELKKGCEYLYFSNSTIKSIKSNNPSIISAERISTFTGDGNQIMFSTKKEGFANIKIETANETLTYSIEIKNTNVKSNNIFIELDVPGLIEQW